MASVFAQCLQPLWALTKASQKLPQEYKWGGGLEDSGGKVQACQLRPVSKALGNLEESAMHPLLRIRLRSRALCQPFH